METQPRSSQATVFLSFSSRDAAMAIALRDGLQPRHIGVWEAPESIPPWVDWASASEGNTWIISPTGVEEVGPQASS